MDIRNKRAYFEYAISDTYVAGIVLTGTEIKSIRAGKANLNDSFCMFHTDGQLYIENFYISEYSYGTYNNHNPKQERKLLLHKKELKKLHNAVKEKGFSIVPLKVFITKNGWAKVEIALAKGKKNFDKRETIKERDTERDIKRKYAL